jgi:hypothetical protein
MTELPQAESLPHVDEGLNPARVEEAFATFADRVRELESVASELRAELQSLRAERAAPAAAFENEDWPAEVNLAHGPLPSADWVATVPPSFARVMTVPRLALEGAFLLLVAGLAGLADLRAGWIVLVMAAAWALVALAEWANAAKRASWRLDEIAPPVLVPESQAADSTGPWDMPVVDATAVDVQLPAPPSESKTMVTKLPADAEEAQPEEPEEPQEPEEPGEPQGVRKRGFGLRRRKQPAEATADPWEA